MDLSTNEIKASKKCVKGYLLKTGFEPVTFRGLNFKFNAYTVSPFEQSLDKRLNSLVMSRQYLKINTLRSKRKLLM